VSAPRALTAAAPRLAAVLLGAACVAWTAVPPRHTGLAALALVVSIIAVVAGALRLALADVPQPEDGFFPSAPVRTWLTFLAVLRGLPWEEIAVVALLWLEVQHPARPWHTAALGFGLAAYLLAVHIAESGAPAGRLLRRQAKLLLAGACLLALGAGFAMLPAASPGAGSALLRVLAAAAVVAAPALVLPGAINAAAGESPRARSE
jgi:phosphatidylserine synthase